MKTILYVDDEADSEKMKSRFEILERRHLPVYPVTNPRAALAWIEEHKGAIALIVLDLIMPPEDLYSLEETKGGTTTGLRLLRDIRNLGEECPIIIISVRRQTGVTSDLSALGVAEYLEKPISAAEIATAIQRNLGR